MEAIHGHQNLADQSLSKIKLQFYLAFHLRLRRFHFRLIHIVVFSFHKLSFPIASQLHYLVLKKFTPEIFFTCKNFSFHLKPQHLKPQNIPLGFKKKMTLVWPKQIHYNTHFFLQVANTKI